MKTWQIFIVLLQLTMACDRNSLSTLFSSPEELLRQRAQEIEGSVQDRLQEKHAGARGSTWNPTQLNLAPDWLLMSSAGLWQKGPDARPAAEPCKSTDADCQSQFTRVLCEIDSDCASGLSCQPLRATVYRLGAEPDLVCQYPSDPLLDALYNIVTEAEQQIDISSLSAPYGRFHEALVNALSIVSQKNNDVQVRILYSGEDAGTLNIFQPPKKYTERLRRDIASRGGNLDALHFNVAWLSSAQFSWNHTKVIVADQKIALQGGHNWWDTDYLGLHPVQDLSMIYEGRAIEDTMVFIDLLWKSVQNAWFYSPEKLRFPPFAGTLPVDPSGDVSALALGRMGVYGDNSSDEGLAALIDAAKNELLIAQQDLFNFTTFLGKPFVADNLFRAVLRGVRIAFIQSNKDGLNYGMVPAAKAIDALRKDFAAFVKLKKLPVPSGRNAEQYFCDTVFYAPIRYSENWSTWANNAPLSLHAKLVVADRAAFYIGSHNLYPANLQEFGLMIFDPGRTREVLDQFWEPMYEASSSARSVCI